MIKCGFAQQRFLTQNRGRICVKTERRTHYATDDIDLSGGWLTGQVERYIGHRGFRQSPDFYRRPFVRDQRKSALAEPQAYHRRGSPQFLPLVHSNRRSHRQVYRHTDRQIFAIDFHTPTEVNNLEEARTGNHTGTM